MISCWDFPDAPALLPRACAIAPRLAALAQRWRGRGWPVIYANDNHGRWRSERGALFDAARQAGGPGARIAELLAPHEHDYFVLKPKHSAFHATPLALLLQHLEVERLALAGVTSDQCVLASASDARMHELEAVVVRDGVAAPSAARTRASIRYFEQVLEMRTCAADQLPAALSKP